MKQKTLPVASLNQAKRFAATPEEGLTAEQVLSRQSEGLVNTDTTLPSKTTSTIIRQNVCTLFNLINFVLALAVLLVGSYKNLLFMGVVLCNLFIGIVQELRAKRTVDRLSLISSATAAVVRGGQTVHLAPGDVVLDDILALSAGQQVPADSILLQGECEVNESFVTGESDPVFKKEGDTLLAGSFVVSGSCRARAERVGAYNYVSSISQGAKQLKKISSEIMRTLQKIILVLSIVILPVGALLFYNQFQTGHSTLQEAVVQTTAALIGMIPEGLMLLTSTVLAVGVIRLSRHKVLVQDLYCIESLARVDTLCLDKTGTLTEGTMEVAALYPLLGHTVSEAEEAARALVCALPERNATFEALADRFGDQTNWQVLQTAPFSSRAKWSGASFAQAGSYVAGATEFVLHHIPDEILPILEELSAKGRVLLLAHSPEPLQREEKGGFLLPKGLQPLAFVLLHDKIRPAAASTLRFFADQGVDIKVISGDSVATVSNIAKQTGVKNWDSAIDCSTLQDEAQIRDAAGRYTVFGRVSPLQKKELVAALKQKGHTVAMTGDGVNDVLALKESDCSIAMASGSEAARNISQLVLLDSNFDAMPRVVAEGRRSVNNLQRSATLFLVKTMYSALLAILFLFIPKPYPFLPIHLTLISSLTIGAPAFVLALEPNNNRIEGSFNKNILARCIPGGLSIVIGVCLSVLLGHLIGLPDEQTSTLCVLLTAFSSFLLLFKLCLPFHFWRRMLYAGLLTVFGLCVALFSPFFSLTALSNWALALLVLLMVSLYGLFEIFSWACSKLFQPNRKSKPAKNEIHL